MRFGEAPVSRLIGLHVIVALLAGSAACSSNSATETGGGDFGTPPGPDVSTPFPIDRGDDGPQTPGSYKSLPLRLATSVSPMVTAVDGVIGFVCVGMSNANQECADFQMRVRSEYASVVNPAVRVVNCAVGGNAIERWIDPAYDATLWYQCIMQRLPEAGVRLDQVRVIYHKAADQFTTGENNSALPLYPDAASDYENFRGNLQRFAERVKTIFPAAQAVYTSSRSYGGFAGSPTRRGEPLSYEEGHALNTWLRTNATIDGVWYGWGPYLWAPDCATAVTNKGGVCYNRADYVSDGVHPSQLGKSKISGLMHERFSKESWYRR
jgi:hypothetical protein